MAGEILTCITFDSASNTCTQEAWMPAPSFLPVLSTADALVLGSAVAFSWAYAWAWKQVIRIVRSRT